MHDIFRLPGLVSAQRFGLSPEQSAATLYQYLVLYQIETNDLAEIIRELKAKDGTDEIPANGAGPWPAGELLQTNRTVGGARLGLGIADA